MAFQLKFCLVVTVLFAHLFSVIYSQQNHDDVYAPVIHRYENSLTEAEESLVFYFAESAIRMAHNSVYIQENATKLDRKNYIAKFIVRHIRMNFGGNWYALVYDSDAKDTEIGSALKSEENHLLRFTYKDYLMLVFKIDSNPCMNERSHILEKINSARNSTVNLDLYHGFDIKEAQRISNIIFKEFLKYTKNFESNSCLNADEMKSTTIYATTNCYYALSTNILNVIEKIHPSIRFILDESLFYSNYNTDIEYCVAFWLGPIYFVAYF